MFEEKQFDELKTKLFIDQLRMDEELVQHPMMLMTVNELTSDAMHAKDVLKARVDVITATAGAQLRGMVGRDGKPPSEARITSETPLVPAVQDAIAEYETAKHDYSLWSGLAEAYREKGGSLKRIAELTIAGFLAPNLARRKEMSEKRSSTQER